MCGIGGVSLKAGNVSSELLEQMNLAQIHRGPDGSGVFTHGSTGLAHVRLSIIDIEGGAQPFNNDGLHLVANGEIYNFHALQDALTARGVSLQSASDCEPILHLYREHGAFVSKQLHGMYAFALFDEATETLVLARDPFGIKPLYYAETDQGVAFASEPAVLSKVGWIEPIANSQAWGNYFNRHYVGGRQTMFKGIERVLPGEVLIIRAGEIVERLHFPAELPAAEASGWFGDKKSQTQEEPAMARFDELFDESVRLHLQADVPYAAYLSGGVDSSALVQKMSAATDELHTFTIGFESTSVADERGNARALTTALNASHETISFGESDFWRFLPLMMTRMDDLTCDYASLPVLKLSELASQHVKVVLCGEGGDEILAGYGRYRTSIWDKLRSKRFRRGGDASHFSDLFKGDISSWREPDLSTPPGLTAIQAKQYLDIQDWLPCDLLTKLDRCTMAYGLEGRVPFLDGALAAYCFGLPDGLKVQGRTGKYLLKKWLSQAQSAINPWEKKKGFTVPVREWLEKKREALATRLVGHDGLADIVHMTELAKLFEAPFGKREGQIVFNLLCYSLWFDVHIKGQELQEL